MSEPIREPDPRLSEWLDGEMSPRDRDRFVAELRVNPQLRADLAALQRTVETARAALAATPAEVQRSAADGERMAAAVLARLAAPRAEAAAARRWTASRWLLGGTLAAALLAAAVWIDRWGASGGEPTTTTVADGLPSLEATERFEFAAADDRRDGVAVGRDAADAVRLLGGDPGAWSSQAAEERAEAGVPEADQGSRRQAVGEGGAAMAKRFGGRGETSPAEVAPDAAAQAARAVVTEPTEPTEPTKPTKPAEPPDTAPTAAAPAAPAAAPSTSDVPTAPPTNEPGASTATSGRLLLQPAAPEAQPAVERLPEVRLQLPSDAAVAGSFRSAVAAESTRKADGERSVALLWSALAAEMPRTGSDDFYLGATRRADSIDGWIVEGSREEVGALLGRLAELAKANGVVLAQGETALPPTRQPDAMGPVAGGAGSGAAKPRAADGPAGPATGGPGGPPPTGPGSARSQPRGAAGPSAERGQPGLPRPGGGRGSAEGPQAPGAPAAGAPATGPSTSALQPKAAAEGERMRVVVRLVPASPTPQTDKR